MLCSIICRERLEWWRWRVNCVDKLMENESSEGERLQVRQSQHVLAAPTYLAIGTLTGGGGNRHLTHYDLVCWTDGADSL